MRTLQVRIKGAHKQRTVIMTLPRRPVPRLDGQVPRKPSFGETMNSVPWLVATLSSSLERLAKRSNTDLTFPSLLIEMMRQ